MNPTAKLFSFILRLLRTFPIAFTHLTISFHTPSTRLPATQSWAVVAEWRTSVEAKRCTFPSLTSAECCLWSWPHLVTLAPDWAHSSQGGRSQFNTCDAGPSGAGASGERTAAAGPGWAELGQAHSATSDHFTLRKLNTGPFSLCAWPLPPLSLCCHCCMSLDCTYCTGWWVSAPGLCYDEESLVTADC